MVDLHWTQPNIYIYVYIYIWHDSHAIFFYHIFAKSTLWKTMTKKHPHLSGFSWIGCYRLSWMWRASRANGCGERQTSWRRVDRWGFLAMEETRHNPWWLMSWGTYVYICKFQISLKKGKEICMHNLLEIYVCVTIISPISVGSYLFADIRD